MPCRYYGGGMITTTLTVTREGDRIMVVGDVSRVHPYALRQMAGAVLEGAGSVTHAATSMVEVLQEANVRLPTGWMFYVERKPRAYP